MTFRWFSSGFRGKQLYQNQNFVNIFWPLGMKIGRSVLCSHEFVQSLRVLRPQINIFVRIDSWKGVAVFEKYLSIRETFRTINFRTLYRKNWPYNLPIPDWRKSMENIPTSPFLWFSRGFFDIADYFSNSLRFWAGLYRWLSCFLVPQRLLWRECLPLIFRQ